MASSTTFWNFIKKNTVEIPIIQRDYAQGRIGKEKLRKVFLNNIKQALEGNLTNGETVLKLDFVYGSDENSKLQPLDGQQRLTTLWLLHWYIALRANKLEEASATLRNFTYETRLSSREFCHSLCDAKNFEDYNSENVVDFITSRTWFYAAWKQDPTIQAMLRMLGGKKIKDKGENIIDGIEELFACPQDCGIIKGQQCVINRTFNEYWHKLTGDSCPIVFYHLPLNDFGLSDDLYIKMNARGKQLTAFENFKAELVGFIRDKELEDHNNWAYLSDAQTGIPNSLDTKWTDLLWKHRSKGVMVKDRQGNDILNKTNQIDEIFLAFMNRLFWNELFMTKDKDTDKFLLTIGEERLPDGTTSYSIENENISYKYLNEDKYDSFADLEPYKYYKKDIPKEFFNNIKLIFDNFIEYNKDLPVCGWDDKGFKFIPEYEKDENGYNIEVENASKETYLKVTSLNQVERIVFFAICKYFKQGKGEEESLRRWMRIVWNLVSGIGEDGKPLIRSTSAMRTAMEFLNMLDSHDVYNSLISNNVVKSVENEKASDFKSRCFEEIKKADQILSGSLRPDPKLREEVIIDAEKYAFFKGSIRFLFTDDSGNVTEDSWKQFDTKWESSKKYFKEIPEQKNVMNKDFDNANLLKALISHFTSQNYWDVLNWKHKVFNNSVSAWRYYLLNDNIFGAIHKLMLGKFSIKKLESSHDEAENRLYQLSQTKLLDFVIKTIPESWIRIYHGHKAIFPSGKGVFLDADTRDRLLTTENLKLKEEDKVPDTNFLYGSNIFFQYNRQFFIYYSDNTVYLMNDNWEGKKLKNQENSDTPENNFYFPVDEEETKDSFLHKLDCLIAKAFPDVYKSVCDNCQDKICESAPEQ